MTVKTPQANWLREPLPCAVINALGADNVKFVGGAVRDTLIGRTPADIDAATRLLPADATARLEAAGLKVFPTGLKHGTVTVAMGKKVMEITTLRVDTETDGRHAEVSFTTDWLEDAQRRDFTFNAIYMASDGSLFDPFDGRSDLLAGKVRFIGEATARIEEDALRVMRFFRFFARYGKGAPDAEALAACNEKKSMLACLSIERVRDELMKMMALDNAAQAIGPMATCSILSEIYGPAFTMKRIGDFFESERLSGAAPCPLLRFYHLGPMSLYARELASRFRLSNDERQFLCDFEIAAAASQPVDAVGIRRFVYLHSKKVAMAAALVANTAHYRDVEKLCSEWQLPAMPVKGRDLLAAGFEPGPAMGACLDVLEQRWIESDFTLGRESLLASLQGEAS